MEDRNKRKHHHQDSRHNNNGKRHRAYQQDHQNDRVEYRRSPSSKDSSHSQEDDAEGHYEGREGDVIKKRYRIIKRLGIGTFGAVFKCHDSKHGDVVALKVVRSIKRYIDSAQIEARVLHDLFDQQKAKGVDVCLKMYSHFKFDDHYCIVCERLGLSLLDLIKKNRYKRTPLRVVRDVSRQLLKALDFLTSIGLVHTDLKLENVLFERSTLRAETVLQGGREVTVEAPVHTAVKLIDFGGATYATDRNKSRIINTRQYRSPEVTLELGWSYPSDMWSAGCIVAEVYSGELLFGTHDELEHLALMEQALEPFPPHMVRASPLRDLFEAGRVKRHCLPRASLREVEAMRPLQRYFQLAPEDPGSGIGDLVKAMLRLDPAKRVTPRQGLLYDFVTEAVEVEGAEEVGGVEDGQHKVDSKSGHSGSSKSSKSHGGSEQGARVDHRGDQRGDQQRDQRGDQQDLRGDNRGVRVQDHRRREQDRGWEQGRGREQRHRSPPSHQFSRPLTFRHSGGLAANS